MANTCTGRAMEMLPFLLVMNYEKCSIAKTIFSNEGLKSNGGASKT